MCVRAPKVRGGREGEREGLIPLSSARHTLIPDTHLHTGLWTHNSVSVDCRRKCVCVVCVCDSTVSDGSLAVELVQTRDSAGMANCSGTSV